METDNTGKNEGARMVASAIVGLDYRIIVVNDKSYIIHPPTIAKIAGATYWLCEAGDGKTSVSYTHLTLPTKLEV